MSDTPVVLVTSRSFSTGTRDVEGELRAAGAEVVRGSTAHDPTELADVLPACTAWIAGTAPIGRDLLDRAPGLRVIARYGTGTDAVDRRAAAERDVLVTNTPGANAEAVADHTLALLLAVLRGIPAGDREVRAGELGGHRRARELGSLAVGLVGFGRVGQGVARRLAGFGSTVLATDPVVPAATVRDAGAEPVGLDEVFARSDVVSLHAPGGTRLVDGARLAGVRRGLVLVNTARADLVDEDAVAAALRDGTLSAYATDTPAAEPGHGGSTPLLAADLADRVVVTAHRAAQTVEAVDRMGAGAVEAVLDVLAGRRPRYVVEPPS